MAIDPVPLLNFIKRFESAIAARKQGVNSAYDVVYGGIKTADRPPRPLSTMKVREVLDWQDSIDAQYPSEAAGAYQIMEDTLRQMVSQGAVDPDDTFDAGTQDVAAFKLLQRRGWDKWAAGEMSAEDFALQVAKEWASMPIPYPINKRGRQLPAGVSYYAGDGLNAAHADVDEFLEAIRATKNAPEPEPAELGLWEILFMFLAKLADMLFGKKTPQR